MNNEKIKNDKLISVVVPVYNVKDYIEACLSSLISQSYKNIEVIAVDDGSTDKSGEICDEFAKKDERIKVLHRKNGGLSAARNSGIDIAKGEYIAFVDSDDTVGPDFIKSMFDICETENCSMAVCAYGEKDNGEGEVSFRIFKGKELLYGFYGKDHIKLTAAWNKLYKRELIGDVRYPEGRIHEDEATTFRFIYCSERIAVTDRVLYHYTNRPGSIMKSGFNKKRLQILDAFKDRRDFYKERMKAGDKEAERFFIREEYCYLSEILRLYSKVKKELPEEKKLAGKLRRRYIREYLYSSRNKWEMKRRVFYFVSLFLPGLYSSMKEKRK